MKVIPPWTVWSMRQLAMSSFVFGFALSVPILCLSFFTFIIPLGPASLPGQAMMALCIFVVVFFIPLHAFSANRVHLNSWKRRTHAIAATLLGISLLPYTIAITTSLAISPGVFNWRLPVSQVALLAFWIVCAELVWAILRRCAPFLIQDGYTCPSCAYCIRGVESQVCPECGWAFDHSVLGLTIAEFDKRYGGRTNTQDHQGAR